MILDPRLKRMDTNLVAHYEKTRSSMMCLALDPIMEAYQLEKD